MSAAETFATALARAFPDAPPQRIGLAVSGGGDSMALMALAADWAAETKLCVATVDHRLRPEAQAEAAHVAKAAAAIGAPHDTLVWSGWDGTGNVQSEARQARYRLLAAWARAHDLDAVLLGHTRDDQAETLLLRLARGSGVDGLAAMARDWRADGVRWLRPLLGLGRAALREVLRDKGWSWIEDPSNEDPRFDRVKARQALAALQPLGITADGLADTADRLADARRVLEDVARRLAARTARIDRGDVVIDPAGFRDAQPETQMRVLANAMRLVSGNPYPPRRRALVATLDALEAGRTTTVDGCQLFAGPPWRITREYAAVKTKTAALGALWDGRWRITGPDRPGLIVRALGEDGLAQAPDWRGSDRPRAAFLADPGLFDGANLLSAPLLGENSSYVAQFCPQCDHFFI